jgi:hypothetical protein
MTTPEVNIHVNETKRPLVALLMADCFCDSICNREKEITIREGLRDYRVGEKVILCRAGDFTQPECGWAFIAKITSVRHSPLNKVSVKDLNADGMKDLTDAVSCLQEFYPNISEKSQVTVIRWELI